MKMIVTQTVRKVILATIVAITFIGCNETSNKTPEIEKTISTDQAELGKLINIERYKPQSVKWVYDEVSGEPGKFNLQAELYFKKETVEELMDNYSLLSVLYECIEKGELGFNWLDEDSKKKLDAQVRKFKEGNKDLNDFEIACHSNWFFAKGNLKGGGFIVLDENTVLITIFTDNNSMKS